MAAQVRCFHSKTVCPPCGVNGKPPSRARHRCPCCGRYLAVGWSICARCMRAQFAAPRLPFEAADVA